MHILEKRMFWTFAVTLLLVTGLNYTCTQTDPGLDEAIRIVSIDTLSTNGSTRATAYSMSNKIISKDGKIFVSWLEQPADIMMNVYDTKSKRWSEPVKVGTGVDNHSGPALTMDDEGYFHVAFGPHHDAFQYKRSVRPLDITEWTAVERFGIGCTYPSLVCGPDGTLYCTYRSSSTDPWRVLFQKRPKGGEWTEPLAVVDADTTGYAQFGNALAVSPEGDLHLSFHIYDQKPPGGKYIGYLRSLDGGTTWETADGKKMSLPVTPKSACILDQGQKHDMRTGNIVLNPDGHPWFTAIHLERSPRTVDVWHHDGQKWQTIDLQVAIQDDMPQKEVVGAVITFDKRGTLYAICTVENIIPQDAQFWGQPSQEVVLLTSADKGNTFSVLPISNPDAETPNWIPSIERPYNHEIIDTPSFVYTHGGPGESVLANERTEVIFVRLGNYR